ncbi:MAG: DUF418 domain-containing protein [Gemmatimonadota bacterium]
MAMLWPGDILALYALLGFVLIGFHRCSSPVLLGWALAMATLPAALLGLHALGRALLSFFAPAGRMALTNYLLQTVTGTQTFHSAGLGYGGLVGPLGWIAFALVVFAAQVVASAIWLRFVRYGPLEWVWRQLTYLRPLPLRVPRG